MSVNNTVQHRKRKKVGPFQFTISQSGISSSVGAGPLRFSLGADGKVRRTIRVPGAGIYDNKVVGGRAQKHGRPEHPSVDPPPDSALRVAQSPKFMKWYETEASRDFQCWQAETRDGRFYIAGRRPGQEWDVRECNSDGTEVGAPMLCRTFDDVKREVDERETNRRA
ncbi:DUF4236 domain-containing protein [Mycobacterium sp.]|uniref:DUF4236 domain-containing protein n=1 Tax=Mycobacterium sp. TaxID=1785 RepID=UPI003F9E63D5